MIENTYNTRKSNKETVDMIIGGVLRNIMIYDKIDEDKSIEEMTKKTSAYYQNICKLKVISTEDEVFNKLLEYSDKNQHLIESDSKKYYVEYSINSIFRLAVNIYAVNDEITVINVGVECNTMSGREKINNYIILQNVDRIVKYINDTYNVYK